MIRSRDDFMTDWRVTGMDIKAGVMRVPAFHWWHLTPLLLGGLIKIGGMN